MDISVILLAGGKGLRTGSSQPKQFTDLEGKKVVLYSFDFFIKIPQVKEIMVVCEEKYQSIFGKHPLLSFARPGKTRQDSLKNGFNSLKNPATFVCIHDAARPLIQLQDFNNLLASAKETKAAALATKVTSTIKEVNNKTVLRTISRDELWEVQTPQILEASLLKKGFTHLEQNPRTVTDDLSIIESLGHPASIVEGSPLNIKITYPSDFLLAKAYLWQIQHTS